MDACMHGHFRYGTTRYMMERAWTDRRERSGGGAYAGVLTLLPLMLVLMLMLVLVLVLQTRDYACGSGDEKRRRKQACVRCDAAQAMGAGAEGYNGVKEITNDDDGR